MVNTGLRLQRCFAQTLGVGALFWQAASGTSSAAIWMMIMTLEENGVTAQADYWRRILTQDPQTTYELAADLADVGAYRAALHWANQAATCGHRQAGELCVQIKNRLSRPACDASP